MNCTEYRTITREVCAMLPVSAGTDVSAASVRLDMITISDEYQPCISSFTYDGATHYVDVCIKDAGEVFDDNFTDFALSFSEAFHGATGVTMPPISTWGVAFGIRLFFPVGGTYSPALLTNITMVNKDAAGLVVSDKTDGLHAPAVNDYTTLALTESSMRAVLATCYDGCTEVSRELRTISGALMDEAYSIIDCPEIVNPLAMLDTVTEVNCVTADSNVSYGDSFNFVDEAVDYSTPAPIVVDASWDGTNFVALFSGAIVLHDASGVYNGDFFPTGQSGELAMVWNGTTHWIYDGISTLNEYNSSFVATAVTADVSSIATAPNPILGMAWDGTNAWALVGTTVHQLDAAMLPTGTTFSTASQPSAADNIGWTGSAFWTTSNSVNVYEYDAVGAYQGQVATLDSVANMLTFDGTYSYFGTNASLSRYLSTSGVDAVAKLADDGNGITDIQYTFTDQGNSDSFYAALQLAGTPGSRTQMSTTVSEVVSTEYIHDSQITNVVQAGLLVTVTWDHTVANDNPTVLDSPCVDPITNTQYENSNTALRAENVSPSLADVYAFDTTEYEAVTTVTVNEVDRIDRVLYDGSLQSSFTDASGNPYEVAGELSLESITERPYFEGVSLPTSGVSTYTPPVQKWLSFGFNVQSGQVEISLDGGTTYDPIVITDTDPVVVWGDGNSLGLDVSDIRIRATAVSTIIRVIGDYVA